MNQPPVNQPPANQPVELSLEQQFSIRSFEAQVQQMSREQAQDFLVKLYEQMITREAMYQTFLKHKWGLEPMYNPNQGSQNEA